MKKNLRTSQTLPPIFVVLFILLTSAIGFSQDTPTPEDPAAPTEQTEPTTDAPAQTEQEQDQEQDQDKPAEPVQSAHLDPLKDPAWQLYQQAFVETLRGHQDAAEGLLNQLIQNYPKHEAVPLAHRVLAVMSLVQADKDNDSIDQSTKPAPSYDSYAEAEESNQPPARTLKNGETTNAQARAELVIFQTLHGIAVGLETCLLLDCNDPKPVFAALTGGAAIGLAGSLYLSRNGVTAGQASTYNTGATWGFWNGIALSNLLDLNDKAFYGALLGGQAVGLGGAALAWHLFEPTAGTVSLANSGQIWATVITTFIHGTTEFKATSPVLWGSLLAASNAGLVAGALLAQEFPMSRGRALVIDSGGILGALVGFSAYVMIASGQDLENAQAAMASGLAGTVLGLGVATYFSRNWDLDDNTSTQVFINPTDGGAIVGLGGRF